MESGVAETFKYRAFLSYSHADTGVAKRVHATYEPVNALNDTMRDAVIVRDYPSLRDDVAHLVSNRPAPLVLIKANVCRVLEPRLVADGFKVLNRGRTIYFPSSGRRKEFEQQFGAILKSAGFD